MRLRFHWVDVFTARPFGGNQLAVFPDGRGLSVEQMQAIARELNLSETTFVLPPDNPNNDFKVRIFTPFAELPMAGHPTVGTAFVLDREGLTGGRRAIRFEEGVGVIPVAIGEDGMIRMTQPLPKFGATFPDTAALAKILSLEPQSVLPAPQPQVVSCGVPFLFVRLAGIEAVRRARARQDLWEESLAPLELQEVYFFSTEVETAGATTHGRMFAPGLGIIEDPATGGASGPLGCYLVHHGLVPAAPRVDILAEQGFEMGRPSFLYITIETEGGQAPGGLAAGSPRINGVHVGGRCCFVAEGWLEIDSTHVAGNDLR